jgi:hypothetical protein
MYGTHDQSPERWAPEPKGDPRAALPGKRELTIVTTLPEARELYVAAGAELKLRAP